MPDADVQLSLDLPLDSPLAGKVKNDRTMMIFNFFALARERVTKLPPYDDGRVKIEVKGTEEGVANIWDKEVLIYLASLIQDKANRGNAISAVVTFTAHDFFRITGTRANGQAYDRLEESLRRLKSTTVFTNIETGGEGEDSGFSWVTGYKIQYRRGSGGEKVMKSISVELCPWIYRAICDGRMLTYDHRYFDLGPIEKRLYEIARAHCGGQPGFKINLENLHRRVGTTMSLRHFKAELVKLTKRKLPLPEYGLILVDPAARAAERAKAPPPNGRTPLKRWLVFFFPTGRLSQMPVIEDVPELPDHDL
jgi:plasmid replication initiation protein